MVPPDLPLRPNPCEVASWFEPPVDYVLDPANHIDRVVEWEGIERHFIEIDWQGHLIWGVTAAILANLADRAERRGGRLTCLAAVSGTEIRWSAPVPA